MVGHDGELVHAEVVTAPRLRTLTLDPEQLDVELRWPGGSLDDHDHHPHVDVDRRWRSSS